MSRKDEYAALRLEPYLFGALCAGEGGDHLAFAAEPGGHDVVFESACAIIAGHEVCDLARYLPAISKWEWRSLCRLATHHGRVATLQRLNTLRPVLDDETLNDMCDNVLTVIYAGRPETVEGLLAAVLAPPRLFPTRALDMLIICAAQRADATTFSQICARWLAPGHATARHQDILIRARFQAAAFGNIGVQSVIDELQTEFFGPPSL